MNFKLAGSMSDCKFWITLPPMLNDSKQNKYKILDVLTNIRVNKHGNNVYAEQLD